MMKSLAACFQVRLNSFGQPATKPKAKPRRASARGGKKVSAATDDLTWPLPAPKPYDLAFAGFLYRPTSASPDNVQCFHCGCQLDGWEENDIPAFEHLTHAPNCEFAIQVCIRLREGDPDRADEDPMSERMVAARRATFKDYWDLDTDAGFPSVDQMAEAGWYFDPVEDRPDGVTCPYCSLSLDSWEAGDDPLEEHRKRADSSNCLFFALRDLYHPEPIPRTKKGKRASTRSSLASTTSTTTKKKAAAKPKTTRGKAAAKDASEPAPAKSQRGTKRQSDMAESEIDVIAPKRKRATRQSVQTESEMDVIPAKPKRGTRQSVQTESESTPPMPLLAPETPTRATPQASEAVTSKWKPVDLDAFFDQENVPDVALLTSPEKQMTIEEFLMHEARRQEENLRMQMTRQVERLDEECRRAWRVIDEL
ncbi:BIR-domain-containing protein [Sporormia fimetaria CBS 119925]|uniref:BIR-domain-containing protein n=1 Tax=Sporormia fimetaria CBS 119925 TaxID=1340428 RepID=A0A6A6VGW3_9PLEO|nr:BIR-domain-containing protein [Sporormia fimetaria CBS 119925]